MRFGWLGKIDWKKDLHGEYREISELIGVDNLIKLLENFQKTPLYFGTSPLEPLLREYIVAAVDRPLKELARETGKSIRSIQRIRREQRNRPVSALPAPR